MRRAEDPNQNVGKCELDVSGSLGAAVRQPVHARSMCPSVLTLTAASRVALLLIWEFQPFVDECKAGCCALMDPNVPACAHPVSSARAENMTFTSVVSDDVDSCIQPSEVFRWTCSILRFDPVSCTSIGTRG